ncbi:hypothetical protein [Mixta sp. Marseille-Q2659]|uniref:hypothetical protein n=1 Tax=Mixta sp. Marseille-Q2659 TaxID=2736607 RepID=UPI0023B9B3C6|nr:hypothetical protein [Mixta sp. Marseille-Q2659]
MAALPSQPLTGELSDYYYFDLQACISFELGGLQLSYLLQYSPDKLITRISSASVTAGAFAVSMAKIA